MLKLFETGEAESLLPVVATVLQFSPAEMQRCRDALHHRHQQLAAANAASEGSGRGDGVALRDVQQDGLCAMLPLLPVPLPRTRAMLSL